MKKTKSDRLIDKEVEKLNADPDTLSRVLRKAARERIQNNRNTRFFEAVYANSATPEVLERRPFLNIGAGSFRHSRWRISDKKFGEANESWTEMRRGVSSRSEPDYDWDLSRMTPLEEVGGFFKLIYMSHVVEHLFDDQAMFAFTEVHRLLEPGGLFRIVCPDADLLLNSYFREDWMFFRHYLQAKTDRTHSDVWEDPRAARCRAAQFVVDWTSLLTHPDNMVTLTPDGCVDFLSSDADPYALLTEASAKSSRALNERVGGHVNWFNVEKLTSMLKRAGFSHVRPSRYLQSEAPPMRDGKFFDRTDPELSLYAEASR